MNKKLIINVTNHETRVALLEDDTIVELFIQRKDDDNITGNIYKGVVRRVLPGMQAAFIDIGLKQAGFIHVSNIIHNQDEAATNRKAKLSIEELITEGQTLLVHVIRSPSESKGARVTSHISLPGRFLVLMPHSDFIGISKRIINKPERQRLKKTICENKPDDRGYIVRTAAEGVREGKIIREMAFLNNLWDRILTQSETAPVPSPVYQELDISLQAVRDFLMLEADSLIVDSRKDYEAIVKFLDRYMPILKKSVTFYQDDEPIFDAYNLEGDISRAIQRKVWLKSGGCIVIDQTEALVAIDVNTGRYVGKHNLEETVLKTNLEALKEIAFQIRLRDIGGIIIIDFIDMEKKINREKVFNALVEALKKDRRKTYVLPMSEIGIIQMTRQKTKSDLAQTLCEPCHYCKGEGYHLSLRSICYKVYREILRLSYDMTGVNFTLAVHPQVAELLHVEENQIISELENLIGKPIIVYPKRNLHIEEFDIVEVL
ncbi:Rne/Rng family ribonuclease [Desulfococcaceae bacterium HSG7]|nr:Rne/Rng family ribonuclease [Desulfococcaceae bacterium HSG7]